MQFFRIVFSSHCDASETDRALLIQWICEWKGDPAVRNEALSTIRSFLKSGNGSSTHLISLIQWSTQQLPRSMNNTEILRVLSVFVLLDLDNANYGEICY